MSSETNDLKPGAGNGDSGKEKLLQDLDGIPYNDDSHAASEAVFEKESAEGLAQLNAEKVPVIIEQLNRGLHQHLKKTRRKKNQLPGLSFMNITVITVLLLIIIAYIVIRKMH